MGKKLIRALLVKPNDPDVKLIEIEDKWKELQGLVGGYIEIINGQLPNTAYIVNEEGKILEMQANRVLIDHGNPVDVIRGNIVIAGAEGGEIVSLTDKQIDRYKEIFKNLFIAI